MKLRYSKVYMETKEVPGQKLPYGLRRDNIGTPTNCRGLLRAKPFEPPVRSLIIPELLRPWVEAYETPYQKREIAKWQEKDHDLIWSCGSGKTLGAIHHALINPGPALFITRATSRVQMQRQVQQYSFATTHIFEGQTPYDLPKCDFLIGGWETIPYWYEEILAWYKRNPGTRKVIWDEIHKAKMWQRTEKGVDPDTGEFVYRDLENISSTAGKIAREVDLRFGLTATPIPNDLSDLWSPLDITQPNCWGTNWDFVHRYCGAQPGKHGGVDTSGKTNQAELNVRLKEVWSIVQKKEAMKTLPPLRRQLTYLRHVDQSRPEGFTRDMAHAARSGKQALFEMQLAESAARKRAWVIDVVTESVLAGQKVTVFTGRRKDAERLGDAIGKALKGKAKTWWAHGETSAADRQAILDAYQACSAGAFIATGDAFGESVDGLQCTDLALFVMLPYTPRQIIQWEGRFHRWGMKSSVLIEYVIAEGTVDEHVADLLLNKLELVGEILDDADVRGIGGALARADEEDEILKQLLLRF
jgi:hypothetical protein